MSDLDRLKSVVGLFFVFLTDAKTCITLPKLKILNLTFFDHVTLDDLAFTQGHKRLRRVFRSVPVTIHVVTLALFRFDAAALPGEAINDSLSKKKNRPLTRPVTSSVTFI